jgi:hypothetical protein
MRVSKVSNIELRQGMEYLIAPDEVRFFASLGKSRLLPDSINSVPCSALVSLIAFAKSG